MAISYTTTFNAEEMGSHKQYETSWIDQPVGPPNRGLEEAKNLQTRKADSYHFPGINNQRSAPA